MRAEFLSVKRAVQSSNGKNKIKYFHFLILAVKNLSHEKARALAVAIPLALIIAIVGAMTFYIEGVEKDALLASDYFPDILLQQQVGGRTESLLMDRYEDFLSEHKAIKSFFPRIWGYINFSDDKNIGKAFVVMGLDPQYIKSGHVLDATIEKGRMINGDEKYKGIIGKALSNALNCGLGDTIEVSSPSIRKKTSIEVVGIFSSPIQIYTADLLMVNTATAREIVGFYEENEYSDVLIYLKNTSMANVVAADITKAIEGARPLTKATMHTLTIQSFGQRSGFFHLIWFILLINTIIIAWSIMSQISFNLKKEIGILKAIGWDTGDIMILKTIEVFLVSAAGVVTGLLMGAGYMLLDAPGLKRFVIGWADIYPDFPIPLYIDFKTVSLLIVLGILPLLAGTLIPVWRIGSIDPDEAIRR